MGSDVLDLKKKRLGQCGVDGFVVFRTVTHVG